MTNQNPSFYSVLLDPANWKALQKLLEEYGQQRSRQWLPWTAAVNAQI